MTAIRIGERAPVVLPSTVALAKFLAEPDAQHCYATPDLCTVLPDGEHHCDCERPCCNP